MPASPVPASPTTTALSGPVVGLVRTSLPASSDAVTPKPLAAALTKATRSAVSWESPGSLPGQRTWSVGAPWSTEMRRVRPGRPVIPAEMSTEPSERPAEAAVCVPVTVAVTRALPASTSATYCGLPGDMESSGHVSCASKVAEPAPAAHSVTTRVNRSSGLRVDAATSTKTPLRAAPEPCPVAHSPRLRAVRVTVIPLAAGSARFA